jgi:hypothetical protein
LHDPEMGASAGSNRAEVQYLGTLTINSAGFVESSNDPYRLGV